MCDRTKSAGKLGGSTSTKRRVLAYFGPSAISAALTSFSPFSFFFSFSFFNKIISYFPHFFTSFFGLQFYFLSSLSPVEKHSPFPSDLCFFRTGAPTL